MLFTHWIRLADSLAFMTAGSNMPTKTPMMVMTTSNSISVKPRVPLALPVLGVPLALPVLGVPLALPVPDVPLALPVLSAN